MAANTAGDAIKCYDRHPPQTMTPRFGVWKKVKSIVAYPELHSQAMNITRLLLAMPRYGEHPPSVQIGWYYGGLMNVFRVDGSPSDQHPTHWMPLPELP